MASDEKDKGFKEEVKVPDNVEVHIEDNILKVKGENGEAQKKINTPVLDFKIDNNKVIISTNKGTKRFKKYIGTYVTHTQNLIEGVQEPFVYELKICSGHFPMNVSVNNDELIIKNFTGEKHPRKVKIRGNADVKVEGDVIQVTSPNKELAGKVASNIENATRRSNYDSRIFQDGIFITKKAGKEIE